MDFSLRVNRKQIATNWAPRFGFALDPFGNAKWAIRGGYGVFFEHLNGNEGISGLEGQPPGILNPTQYNVVGYTNIGGGGLSGTTGITAYTDQMRWPYVQQWHFDVQHDIAKDTVAISHRASASPCRSPSGRTSQDGESTRDGHRCRFARADGDPGVALCYFRPCHQSLRLLDGSLRPSH
jgi:hypothetical protein